MTPPNISPLRQRLCSRENAVLVARRMFDAGIPAAVVGTCEPLQPWRVTEVDDALLQGTANAPDPPAHHRLGSL